MILRNSDQEDTNLLCPTVAQIRLKFPLVVTVYLTMYKFNRFLFLYSYVDVNMFVVFLNKDILTYLLIYLLIFEWPSILEWEALKVLLWIQNMIAFLH